MKLGRNWIAAAAVTAALAACGGDGGASRGLTPTAPRLDVGPTTHVTVACPTAMDVSTSGTCTAFGYDANNLFTNSSVSSWSSSNTGVITITSGGGVTAVGSGTSTITAVIDGVSGTTSISVPAPLSVSIGGPSSIRSNTTCYWWANVTGGTGTLSYSWSGGTTISAVDSEYYARSSSNFTVRVTVSDSNGHSASASKAVTVSSSAGICPV